MGMADVVLLGLIGLVGGVVGGMLGIGGSVVMIPAMTELLGPNQHLYQAAAMVVNFFVVVPAVLQHRKVNAIDWEAVRRLVPLAVLAVLAGVSVSESQVFREDGEAMLRSAFGAFLIITAAAELLRIVRDRMKKDPADLDCRSGECGRKRVSWRLAACVALPTGLIAGMLGVGGGLLAVPLQRRILHIPLRQSIANSAAIIIPTSLIGAAAKNLSLMERHVEGMSPLVLAAILIPVAMIGSYAGSRWTHVAPLRMIRAAFLVLLLVAGTRLIYSAATSIR